MKQEIVTSLNLLDKEIFNISRYIYDNPEKSFHEYKCSAYLIDILKKHSFNVIENFMNMPTAFYGEYGIGHPKICFICEYDSADDLGHISGHNLISSISIAAALSLTKAVDKIGGSIVVIGCPGEYVGSSKVTMVRQGVFNGIDAVLMAHPNTVTAESGSSTALIPLEITYTSEKGMSFMKSSSHSALDAGILTFNAINALSKGFNSTISVNGVITEGGTSPALLPHLWQGKFYIRGSKMCHIEPIEKKIRDLVKYISNLLEVHSEISLYELPYEELITNSTLSRIFSHNLKESGLIDIDPPKDTFSSLSLGTVSHVVPCIHPYISIVESDSIKYSSPEFAMVTISRFAHEKVMKVAQALAITALDLLQKESLLSEIKLEFNKTIKKE
ncbi:M20 family peptidase [uncultured Clostridium sp.]|uniref:M20 family peptidase n=1 Tax=uncultured Clostridium sp. TaxID=59620 RepID=UPI0028E608EC|nr:M20 family peptidase [uncultured Clostridium sp.]